MNAHLPLSPQVFAIFSDLIEERLGIHYALDDRELLAERLTPRALERGFDSLLDYYYYLRYDAEAEAELAELAEALVVNETYFFREERALSVVADSVVPRLLEAGVRPRIWSAACSTGEEPLTLAMLLDARNLLGQVQLLASDISRRALRQARAGVYGRRSLRALPSGVLGRWLEPDGDGARVVPRIRDAVAWQRVNLRDPAALAALGEFDVILCRNVLIYFQDATIAAVVRNLTKCLRRDGLLVVGTSESLLRLDCALACEEQGGAFFYRNAAK
ncbi:MAG TPA: CheR family methyltransferase [Polyangiaceae bacterium]|jgi:chemotaxis protein methyltransferase CheR|nr:CheR family methyltransferase [Polyangiaceae bacterium]